jgi:hypothetical protein
MSVASTTAAGNGVRAMLAERRRCVTDEMAVVVVVKVPLPQSPTLGEMDERRQPWNECPPWC